MAARGRCGAGPQREGPRTEARRARGPSGAERGGAERGGADGLCARPSRNRRGRPPAGSAQAPGETTLPAGAARAQPRSRRAPGEPERRECGPRPGRRREGWARGRGFPGPLVAAHTHPPRGWRRPGGPRPASADWPRLGGRGGRRREIRTRATARRGGRPDGRAGDWPPGDVAAEGRGWGDARPASPGPRGGPRAGGNSEPGRSARELERGAPPSPAPWGPTPAPRGSPPAHPPLRSRRLDDRAAPHSLWATGARGACSDESWTPGGNGLHRGRGPGAKELLPGPDLPLKPPCGGRCQGAESHLRKTTPTSKTHLHLRLRF